MSSEKICRCCDAVSGPSATHSLSWSEINIRESAETRIFLRDCYDHAVQLMDLLEVYREMCGDLRDG